VDGAARPLVLGKGEADDLLLGLRDQQQARLPREPGLDLVPKTAVQIGQGRVVGIEAPVMVDEGDPELQQRRPVRTGRGPDSRAT
jgi:hypothetical protein